MIHYTALLDANVLYFAPIRDLFLQLAVSDVFRARWAEDIHREWIDALVRNVPHPHAAVGLYGVEVQHPDEFLSGHLNLVPTVFCEATRRVRNRLKSPPFTVQEYLINLSRQGLVATASELERFTGSI